MGSKYTNPWATVHKRFFSKIRKTKTCWWWLGHKDPNGYGRIGMGRKNLYNTHRMSYLIHKGQIPKGKLVMHSCDHPSCVNPDHLQLGTYSQNLKDAYQRGLHKPRGRKKCAK